MVPAAHTEQPASPPSEVLLPNIPQPTETKHRRIYGGITVALLCLFFFVPLPYYESKQLTCPFGPSTCPNPGWKFNPSIFQSILLLKSTKQENTEITPAPSSAPSPTSNPITEWKTYTNSQYAFSFRYPPNITFTENTAGHNQSIIELNWHQAEPYFEFGFQLTPMSPKNLMSLTFGTNENKEETIIVSGIKGSKITADGGGGSGKQVVVSFIRNNVTYFFFTGGNPALTDQILSTFRFLDTTAVTPTTVTSSSSAQTNGADLQSIRYKLPTSWTATLNSGSLRLAPQSGGGYLSIEVFNYPGVTGRRDYYCQLRSYCIAETVFTETTIGNISGYQAIRLDNSGGGAEYFGTKGNKFYIISTFAPPSSNNFDAGFQSVVSSLIF